MIPFFIDDITDIILEIYVVGYHEKGESIVLFLCDKSQEKAIFTAVIDCFCFADLNKTYEILQDRQIESTDLLCWTHPDEDHTKGLDDIINQFCTHKTKFILPEGIYGKKSDILQYSEDELKLIQTINSYNTHQNYCVNSISANPSCALEILKYEFSDNIGKKLIFSIDAVAPISAIIRRRIDSEPEKIKNNDFSIALLVNLGNMQFFLSGDIENQTIQQLSENFIDNLVFLKIPHHASQSSNLLLSKIVNSQRDTQIPISCTTVYKSHNLPNPELMEEYKIYSEKLHSTGFNDFQNFNYGIMEYSFEPLTEKIIYNLYGNAEEL